MVLEIMLSGYINALSISSNGQMNSESRSFGGHLYQAVGLVSNVIRTYFINDMDLITHAEDEPVLLFSKTLEQPSSLTKNKVFAHKTNYLRNL